MLTFVVLTVLFGGLLSIVDVLVDYDQPNYQSEARLGQIIRGAAGWLLAAAPSAALPMFLAPPGSLGDFITLAVPCLVATYAAVWATRQTRANQRAERVRQARLKSSPWDFAPSATGQFRSWPRQTPSQRRRRNGQF